MTCIVDVDVPKKFSRMQTRSKLDSSLDEPIDIQPIQEKPCFALSILKPRTLKQRQELHEKHLKEKMARLLAEKSKIISEVPKKEPEMAEKTEEPEDPSEKIKKNLNSNLRKLRFDQSLIHQYGVYTTDSIQKGQEIIEYVGEIVRLRVADKRQVQYEAEGNNGSYVFQLDKDKFIDATRKGGLARFINHSCSPNCVTDTKFFDGEYHIIISAKRSIDPFEELTYDYKMEYETKDKRIPCLCGSPNCKKWLNWSPKAEKELTYKWSDKKKPKKGVKSAPDDMKSKSDKSNKPSESKVKGNIKKKGK